MTKLLSRRSALTLGAGAALATPLGACWRSQAEVTDPLPEQAFAPVPGVAGRGLVPLPPVDIARFDNRVTLLHVWATWCPTCRAEREVIATLVDDTRYTLAGLAWRDDPEKVRAYLASIGNPYAELSLDDGYAKSKLRLVGVPTTFVIGRDRRIVKRLTGPLTVDRITLELRPAIRTALEIPPTA
ncbi:MAG: redoxin family protein [Proteobacteria bacterium]|nr:redoxin family protein [Pseudomonadota bacterium]